MNQAGNAFLYIIPPRLHTVHRCTVEGECPAPLLLLLRAVLVRRRRRAGLALVARFPAVHAGPNFRNSVAFSAGPDSGPRRAEDSSRTTLGPGCPTFSRAAVEIGGAGQASSRRSRVVLVLLWKHGRGRIAEAPAGVVRSKRGRRSHHLQPGGDLMSWLPSNAADDQLPEDEDERPGGPRPESEDYRAAVRKLGGQARGETREAEMLRAQQEARLITPPKNNFPDTVTLTLAPPLSERPRRRAG